MLGDFGGVSLLSRSAIQDPDVPLSLKGHTSSCPNPFNAYICIMYTTNTRERLRGVQDFLVTKVICTCARERERERTKEPFYYEMVTLRLTRASFVFCTVKIFSLFSSYCLLICVTFAPLMDPKNNLTRNEIYITNRKIKNIILQTWLYKWL